MQLTSFFYNSGSYYAIITSDNTIQFLVNFITMISLSPSSICHLNYCIFYLFIYFFFLVLSLSSALSKVSLVKNIRVLGEKSEYMFKSKLAPYYKFHTYQDDLSQAHPKTNLINYADIKVQMSKVTNCDAIKQNESKSKFCFFVFWHILLGYYLSFNLMKISSRLGYWFLRYTIFSNCKNNEKQRNYLLCLAIYLNQHLWFPTHFAWLHHGCVWHRFFTYRPNLAELGND